ncbi:hypothetical protein [Actinoallomurus acaciae]|uniref:Uncharacterized protein n=1 Tax=Actinoallomurus acaciae TaxID=502577 RepID=A0ABV5YB61_9ACTN
MDTLTIDPIEDLFTSPPALEVPPLEIRNTYKKESGSSDGQNTQDEIKT